MESESFIIDRLIEEVEKRKALYDKGVPGYSDKFVKEKLWAEVAAAIVFQWSDLSEVERRVKCK